MKFSEIEERHVWLAIVFIVAVVIVCVCSVVSYYETQQTIAYIKAGYTKQMVSGYEDPVWVKP